jgi:Leucine-rich repeat (LRR) protein
VLDAQGNLLDALPDDLLAWSNCSISHLLLAKNALVDFNVTGTFANLVQFDFSFNPRITRVPNGVDALHMPVLVELDAQHCSIAELPPLAMLASLAVVDLANNQLTTRSANHTDPTVLCGPFAAKPQLLCQLAIVRLSNNRLTNVPDLSCCARLATLLVDNNLLDRVPPWIASLPALRSFAAGSLLTDSSLLPLRSLQRRLDLLDLSNNLLVFPPPFLFQLADQLMLASNNIRDIDGQSSADIYFSGTRWMDLSNNQLRALPSFDTAASVVALTLRMLFAHNNLISGRVPFIPVDTLTLYGNPEMHVPGDRLNLLPLTTNAGSTFFQLLSLDEPFVFWGATLTCKTFYRDRQVVAVTGMRPDVWQLLATTELALDPSYFSYRHCRCRATYYGYVGSNGDNGSCVPCASAFSPFRAAHCDNGGDTLSFASNTAPLFACADSANQSVEQMVQRMSAGGVGCKLVAFEPCANSVCVQNSSAPPVVQRDATDADSLSGELCAEGHTGRLCAGCVADGDSVYYRTHDGGCELCPDLPIGMMLGVTITGVVLIMTLFVALPRAMRRWWPLAATIVLAVLGVTMYVGDLHAVVFGDILWFSMSLTFVTLLGQRRNRIDTAERLSDNGADKGGDHSNAGLKVMLFYVQTAAAVASESFPSTTAAASSLTFAKPGAIGVACATSTRDCCRTSLL